MINDNDLKEISTAVKDMLKYMVKAPNEVPEGAFPGADMIDNANFATALLYIIELLERKQQ